LQGLKKLKSTGELVHYYHLSINNLQKIVVADMLTSFRLVRPEMSGWTSQNDKKWKEFPTSPIRKIANTGTSGNDASCLSSYFKYAISINKNRFQPIYERGKKIYNRQG